MRQASPMACAEVAQAETGAKFGPWRPNSIETNPLAMLEIIIGIIIGEMRPGPLVIKFVCWSSSDFSPPMPEPMMTPKRSGSSGAPSSPASAMASFAAAIPSWEKRSARLASFGSLNQAAGSKPLTSPPIWQS